MHEHCILMPPPTPLTQQEDRPRRCSILLLRKALRAHAEKNETVEAVVLSSPVTIRKS